MHVKDAMFWLESFPVVSFIYKGFLKYKLAGAYTVGSIQNELNLSYYACWFEAKI